MFRAWLARLESALNPLFYLNGSISVIQLDLIPESNFGFSIVKQWTSDILVNLDPSRPQLQGQFVTNLLKATNIGFQLDERFTYDYLKRFPAVKHASYSQDQIVRLRKAPHIHPGLILRRPDHPPFYVLRGLLDFLGEGPGVNLKHGILFFEYVAVLLTQSSY